MLLTSPISFPNLGITVDPSPVAFTVMGKDIYWYGIIIASGFLLAVLYMLYRAKTFGITQDDVLDLVLWAVPIGVVCARLYYCVFYWELYRDNPISMLYIWEGGLAIYGGVIAGILTLLVFTKKRHLSFLSMADSACLGLITGQMIGRWGNFINCEAFGRYTDCLFAMRIRRSIVNESMISQNLLDHLILDNGIEYIQVHPTFLYESLWNFGLLMFMLWFRKRKTFTGEMLCIYLAGYGIGRAWIEGLRTDSLLIPGTQIAVSQALSVVLATVSLVILIYNRRKAFVQGKEAN